MTAEDTYPRFHGKPLFSFGTLQDADVFRIVSGGLEITSLQRQPAWLSDYCACGVLDGLYPVLRAAPGAKLSGTLFPNVAATVIDRLIWFESPEFAPALMHVETEENRYESICFRPAKAPAASSEAWSLQAWKADKKSEWIRYGRLAMHFYGVLTAHEMEQYWDRINACVYEGRCELPASILERCKSYLK